MVVNKRRFIFTEENVDYTQAKKKFSIRLEKTSSANI